jgi:hypothetical protein
MSNPNSKSFLLGEDSHNPEGISEGGLGGIDFFPPNTSNSFSNSTHPDSFSDPHGQEDYPSNTADKFSLVI